MGLFSKKNKGYSPSAFVFPRSSSTPRRGDLELMKAYREMPWLRAVTQRISTGVACATWRLYATKAGGKYSKDSAWANGHREGRRLKFLQAQAAGSLQEITDHPLLTMLAKPNARMTGRQAIQVCQTHLDLKGESFWLMERNPAGMPVGYWPVPPHWVTSCPTAAQPFYKISSNVIQADVPPSEMIWLRDIDPENPYGRGSGVAESLGDELDISEYASKHVKAWFTNGAMPAAIIQLKGASPDQAAKAREAWERQHTGFWSAFKNFFTGAEIAVERMDTSFADQELNDLRTWQHHLIREVFAVPPEVMGVIENSNRSTIDAAQFIFATGVLVPRLEFLRSELQTRLIPQFDDRLVLEYDTPVPEAREFQLQTVQAIPEAFELNEVRSIAGFEAKPELDGLYAQHASGAASPADQAAESEPLALPSGKSIGFKADPQWVSDASFVTKRKA